MGELNRRVKGLEKQAATEVELDAAIERELAALADKVRIGEFNLDTLGGDAIDRAIVQEVRARL